MAKKTGPLTTRIIGKGISKMEMVSVDLTDPRVTFEDIKRVVPQGDYTFEGRVAFAEEWATKILQNAGLPADPTAEVIYERDGVKLRGQALSSLSTEERVSERWYAAKIMNELRLVRTTIERGKVDEAARLALDLGMLLRELFDVMLHNKKVLKWEGWQGSGSIGGSRDKKIRPVLEWLLDTVKGYQDKPWTFYWNSLPDHDEGDAPIDVGDAEMIREDRLLKIIYDDGRRRSITKRAFERYVTDAKKLLLKKSPKK